MISASQAAKFLCRESDWSLSNLSLQKILYLAHMFYMGENNGTRLVDNDFEAWDFGPVVPALYRRVKAFGSEPIKNIFYSVADVREHSAEEILSWALEEFGSLRPGQLVNITHGDDGAWARAYAAGKRGIVIPDEYILDEYRDRVETA